MGWDAGNLGKMPGKKLFIVKSFLSIFRQVLKRRTGIFAAVGGGMPAMAV